MNLLGVNVVLFHETKEQYYKRTLFPQFMAIFILILYFLLLIFCFINDFYRFLSEISLNRRILIIVLFLLYAIGDIVMIIYAFSKRVLIIEKDGFYPPKVPFKYILKKKDYKIEYKDIEMFQVYNSPKGEIEGVTIKHRNRYIHIHTTRFSINAVLATINQLRRKIEEKERKLSFG